MQPATVMKSGQQWSGVLSPLQLLGTLPDTARALRGKPGTLKPPPLASSCSHMDPLQHLIPIYAAAPWLVLAAGDCCPSDPFPLLFPSFSPFLSVFPSLHQFSLHPPTPSDFISLDRCASKGPLQASLSCLTSVEPRPRVHCLACASSFSPGQ